MKTNIKNFLRIIRRFKMAVALNMLGLSVAFAAFMVIMIQLDYDFGFDKSHKDYDKIFRVEFSSSIFTEEASWQTNVTRPFADQFIGSSPHILAGAFTYSIATIKFHVENENGERHYYEDEQLVVSSSFCAPRMINNLMVQVHYGG